MQDGGTFLWCTFRRPVRCWFLTECCQCPTIAIADFFVHFGLPPNNRNRVQMCGSPGIVLIVFFLKALNSSVLSWALLLTIDVCRPDPDSIWELDLSLQLFQFFFTGMKNQSRFSRILFHVASSATQSILRIYLPDKGDIFSTGMRRNFSKITNDISFIGGSRATQSPRSKSTASAHFVVVFMVFLGTILVIF